jgi:hypothetical protein
MAEAVVVTGEAVVAVSEVEAIGVVVEIPIQTGILAKSPTAECPVVCQGR